MAADPAETFPYIDTESRFSSIASVGTGFPTLNATDFWSWRWRDHAKDGNDEAVSHPSRSRLEDADEARFSQISTTTTSLVSKRQAAATTSLVATKKNIRRGLLQLQGESRIPAQPTRGNNTRRPITTSAGSHRHRHVRLMPNTKQVR